MDTVPGAGPAEFGGWLRVRREQAMLSQRELAEVAGVSARTIRALEAGEVVKARPATVRLLNAALGRDSGGLRVDQPPAQLPGDVRAFTARTEELTELDGLLGDSDAGAVPIAVLAGTAGVGKTATAVHWAHRAKHRFPDGQLYVDLRGFDPDLPLSAGDALAGFLRGLGMRNADVPADLAERAALFRTLIVERRMLVLLDNARDVEQVRPLLPGTASCRVLITSRNRLPGLVARHGAQRMDLDLLPMPDCVALVTGLVRDRATADPSAVQTLAGLCGRLPLALRTAAELVITRSTVPLVDLIEEISDERLLLDRLDDGNERTSVRAVFSWSCRHLPPGAAAAFDRLGLHPGPTFGPYELAALLDIGRSEARSLLDTLHRAHLVEELSPGRYSMHDLLRVYAAERGSTEPDPARTAAMGRLLDYYLGCATAATAGHPPLLSVRRPESVPITTPVPRLDTRTQAIHWLEAELPNLVAVAVATARTSPRHAVGLATVLWLHLHLGSHHDEATDIHGAGLAAAVATGDRPNEARMRGALGTVFSQQGRQDCAQDHYRQAVTLFRQTGDIAGEAGSLSNLGVVAWQTGEIDEAIRYFESALARYREIDEPAGQGRALGNIGHAEFTRSRYPAALTALTQALMLFRAAEDRTAEATTLTNMGRVHLRTGDGTEAFGLLTQALARHREEANALGEAETLVELGLAHLGRDNRAEAMRSLENAVTLVAGHKDHQCLASALDGLGLAHRAGGDIERALEFHGRALEVASAAGNRPREASARNGMGEALRAVGRGEEAADQYGAALRCAEETGDRYEQARAHGGLARINGWAIPPEQTREHEIRASILYGELGVPYSEACPPGSG